MTNITCLWCGKHLPVYGKIVASCFHDSNQVYTVYVENDGVTIDREEIYLGHFCVSRSLYYTSVFADGMGIILEFDYFYKNLNELWELAANAAILK